MFNLHKKLIGEVPMTYNGIGAGTAALISAGVGLATTAVVADKQNEATKKAEDEANTLQNEASATEARILGEQANNAGNTATANFGLTDDEEDTFGSYDDFLTPMTASASAGLGQTSDNTSPLGFAL